MKFDIDKPVNLELLREEFAAEFGPLARVEASTIVVPDDLGERARELLDEHDGHQTTKKQRAVAEWKSHVRAAQSVLGLVPGETTFEDFVEVMQDSEKVSALVWMLWLQLNPPEV